MKKILVSMMTIALVSTLIGGGIYAAFSDTETTGNNTMSAGTLDLDYGGGNGDEQGTAFFTLADKAPGDSGSATQTIANAGNATGTLDVSVSAITNTAGAGGTEYEGGSGELGGVATIAIWIDVDESGTWNTGDIELESDGTAVDYDTDNTLDGGTIDSYDSDAWSTVTTMSGAAQDTVQIDWAIPSAAGNTIQGDSISFTITFTLNQA
jgi:predicted ribosomally synthesized peptide with SipW-like signal peptide